MIGGGGVALSPGNDLKLRKFALKLFGALRGAIGDGDGRAFGQQRRRDCSCAASRPQQQRGTGPGVHTMGAEIGQKSPAIRIGTGNFAILECECVHRPGAPRGLIHHIAHRERGEFVRDRDVGPRESRVHQATDRGGEMLRWDGKRDIGPVDLIFIKPVAMQSGRAGMSHRPADDPSNLGVSSENRHGRMNSGRRGRVNGGCFQVVSQFEFLNNKTP